jgi:hypothetical protein
LKELAKVWPKSIGNCKKKDHQKNRKLVMHHIDYYK